MGGRDRRSETGDRKSGAGAVAGRDPLSDLYLWALISDLCTRLRRVLGAGCERSIRAIRTARLHGLPRFDLRPIDVVVDHGSRRDLVLRRVSRLDALSGYPDRT
jgi:hypothetical protein